MRTHHRRGKVCGWPGGTQNPADDLSLSLARAKKENPARVIDDRECESYAPNAEPGDKDILDRFCHFVNRIGAGKKRCCVPVVSRTEENEVQTVGSRA